VNDLSKPSYFINGASVFSQQNKIYGLGFGIGKQNQAPLFVQGEL